MGKSNKWKLHSSFQINLMPYCYFNGSVVDESEAMLSPQGLGTVRGFGVFDFFRMRNGSYTFLQDHLDRFERSQKFMGLSHIIGQDEIKDALDTLKDWNNFPDGGFKLVLLGEGGESDPKLSPFFYILNTNLNTHQAPPFASVILHDYQREYPLIKSTNYFTSLLLHRKRLMAGAVDVIYHKAGLISEASRSNVFVVKDGRMITPGKNILEGISRKQVLTVAPDVIETEVGEVTVADFLAADEVFICSTLKEICPIMEVDGKPIGKGKVGSITRKISQLYLERVRG